MKLSLRQNLIQKYLVHYLGRRLEDFLVQFPQRYVLLLLSLWLGYQMMFETIRSVLLQIWESNTYLIDFVKIENLLFFRSISIKYQTFFDFYRYGRRIFLLETTRICLILSIINRITNLLSTGWHFITPLLRHLESRFLMINDKRKWFEMISLFSFEVKFLKARFGQMCKCEIQKTKKRIRLVLNCREYFAMKSSSGLQQFLAVESHFGQFFIDTAI